MRKTFLFILALCAASAVWGTTTVTRNFSEFIKSGETTGTRHATVQLDDNVVLTSLERSGKQNGLYYNDAYDGGATKTPDWRHYQARDAGKFTISVPDGYVLVSAQFTFHTKNEGDRLSYNETLYASKDIIPLSGNLVTLSVANNASATDGQIKIHTFTVTYEKGIYDDFRDPTTGELLKYTTAIESVTTQCFTWTTYKCRFNTDPMDKLADNTPSNTMWQSSASYLSTTVEGGIKTVFFPWNQAAAAESGNTETVTVTVDKDNTKTKSQSREGKAAADRGADSKFSYACNVSKNAEVKIAITSGKRITVGPITIVPYLRYTYTEMQQVNDDESTFDCSLQIDNTDGEGAITYSSDNTNAVSFADPANPEATIVGGGEATITATWGEASTSFKLKVNVLPVPTVTFPGIMDGKKSVALDVESFTEAAEVDMEVPIVYSSSNENVAMVNEDGEVTVLTTGTTEITAKVEAKKGEYKEASATYTLTVTASEASEDSFVEKFSGVSRCDGDCGYTKEAENFIGTDGLFHWTVNSVRLRKGDVIGKGGLRFSASLEEGSYHLLPDPNYNDGIMEGGIKRIAFTYKEAEGGSGVNLEISANSTKRTIKTEPKSGVELSFAANFFVKENTSLKMFNTKSASVVTIGPISIVPYLLFTTKSDEAFLSLVDEYDVKNVLINNTDDGTVAYSILTEGAKSQINDGVVSFDEVTKSETITIQAAWTPDGESSATVITTMTLYVDVESKTDKTVEEKFSNYGETGWTSSEANEVTKNGDVYDWRTKSTRHNTADKLVDDQQAIWFAQGGYVATAIGKEGETIIGPAEGGIKRIAFDWNQNGANQTGDDLYISISVDDDEVSAIRRDGGAQPEQPWQYIHNLNVKKNATLKIENKSTTSKSQGGRVKIGTIVITPYLLYTKKELSAKLSDKTAINVDICNNTIGGAISYSSLNPEVASLANNDPSHPDKLILNSVGDAVIVATWTPDGSEEVVTTSYTLHVTEKADRGLSFQDAVKETTVGGSGVTNTLNGTFDGTAQTWSTASEGAITSVDNDGLVSAVAIGTDTVTVVVAESDAYQEGTASYKVIVRTGVDDNNKLVESFSGITKDASTSETEWEGDLQNYFSWKVKSTRHKGTAGDTIGGAGVAGTVLFAQGQIATNGVIEGGIKYFTFNWKQPYVEAGATLRLTLEAGEESYQQDYIVATDNGSTTHEHLYFAGNMQVKKNVQLTLKNESFKTDGGAALTEYGRIAIDKFEIVPYLFYTTKSHTIENATEGATYTNTDLINNIDNNEGTITYSLIGEGDDAIAEINDETGEVTVKTGGVVTVQAKWVPDDTKQEEFVTTTYTLTINFPQPTITFNDIEVVLDGTVTPDITVKLDEEDITETATISYEVADENIATWDATNGWKLKTNGSTQVTANVARTTKYGAASKTAKIEVTNITPADGTYWTETFSSIGNVTEYITDRKADIVGDSSIYSWAMRNYRRRQTQADSLATEQAIRLSNAKNNYIETLNNQEGGIKRISFNWRTPGAEADQLPINLNVSVCYNNNYQDTVKRPMTRAKSIDNMTDNSYCSNFFVKQNAKLKIDITPKTGDVTYSTMLIGPITITPYLLYTTKTDTLNLTESSTYKNEDLINNLEQGDEVTYSIIQGNEGEIASIETDGTVTATAAGEITIQAKWTDDGDNTITTTYKLKIKKCITISESVGNSDILAANDGQTVDVKIVRSALVANTWNSLCLPFDIEKSELGDAKVAILDHATLEGDVLNIWLAPVTGTLTAGTPYLVLPNTAINLSGDYEGKQIVANVEDQEVNMVTLKGIFSPFEMTANDETKLFLGQPDEGGHNLFYPSQDGSLKGMRAYFQLTTPNNIPVRVGRIGIQQTPTELGGEADRLNGRQAMKVLRDGQFYIIRETKTYNAQGIEIQ